MNATTQTREGRSALEDVLGQWLNGNHQAEIDEMRLNLINTAVSLERNTTERNLYQQMWREEMQAAESAHFSAEIDMQRRDRLISMLMHTLVKSTIVGATPQILERLHLMRSNMEMLRQDALNAGRYATVLIPFDALEDGVLDEVAAESISDNDSVIDLTTEEEDNDDNMEVIDLTMEDN